MVSLVQPLENGGMIEVGMIGNEGFVGVPVLLGADTLAARSDGPDSRIGPTDASGSVSRGSRLAAPPSRECCFAMPRRSTFRSRLRRHAMDDTPLPERLARWLLTAHDRAPSDELPLGHEFLSMMLGVRRAGVTVALGALKTAAFVRNSNGRVTIVDRPGLEAAVLRMLPRCQE